MTAEPILSVRGLLAKRGWRTVVDDVSLEIYPGDRIFIRGENGSGKSTLLEALLGLLPSKAERREWLGAPGEPSGQQAFSRGQAVYLRQNRNVFPSLTLRQNILLGCTVDRSIAGRVIRGLTERIPELASALDRAPSHASAGQRQLAAACRIFLHRPQLLVLDEPTAGVGTDRIPDIFDLLRMTLPVTAVILVDQHTEAATRWANRAYSLSGGRLERSAEEVRNV